MSPSLATSRIINRSESPAFILFQKSFNDLEKAVGFQLYYYPSKFTPFYFPFDYCENAAVEAEDILNNLIHNIDFQFATGVASARDQDEDGKTLLHVSNSILSLITPQHTDSV